MAKYKIGQKFYNHGDMANVPGWFILDEMSVSKFGTQYRLKEINGNRESWVSEYTISDIYKGNGSTRIVPEQAYFNYKNQQMAYIKNFISSKQAI